MERLPQKINERPPPYIGRDDLETLMASPLASNWVKIRCFARLSLICIHVDFGCGYHYY